MVVPGENLSPEPSKSTLGPQEARTQFRRIGAELGKCTAFIELPGEG